ncbi:MAG: TIGR00725 family protein [Candidatus Odinarchaeota archaeon]|nr:TIGR00725 family protein [Candidatus Odinarchaeota archaeon]
MQVTVIGDSNTNEKNYKIAYELGKILARENIIVINGGRGGIMEAVCKGVREIGGISVCILPSGDRREANKYCKIVIPTGIGFARNSINVLAGDGIIAIGGRAGTLSEFAFAWIYNKPIVVIEGTNGWSDKLKNKKVDDRRNDYIYRAVTAEDAVKKIKELISNRMD